MFDSRAAGCDGKVPFDTYHLAAAAAAKRRGKKPRKHKKSKAYRCRHCGLWHLGYSLDHFNRSLRAALAQEEAT